MRAVHDAILIGVGTALSDDPRLDVRHPDFPDKPNKVIILDPGFRLRGRFRDLAMSRCHRESDFLVVVGKSHSTQAHTWPADSVMPFDFDVPPPLRMRELAAELFRAHGISATLVEGGARTYAGFLESRCVDRLSLFVAPKVFGRGLRWSHYFEQASGNLPWGLTNVRSSALGEDVLITGRVEYSQT